MLLFFYQISIPLYSLIIGAFSPFNLKAKQWFTGRKQILKKIKTSVNPNDKIYWFHCASLGEFEQGKPIIDELKEKNNSYKILITFFSPSGYELRKNYKNADYVFYLPIDTKYNAQQFINAVQPEKAFFIKYEFWYNYLAELNQNKIPVYLISGAFRKEQPFFKWYGSLHRQMLSYFTHFFVQNSTSKDLLNKLNFNHVTITGDTRIDRVYENSLNPTNIPLIKSFKGNRKIIIAGSSWQKEEEILVEHILSSKKNFKYIIAPHDVSETRIKAIEKSLNKDCIRYSQATSKNISNVNVLIIDSIGILSNIYQYTDIAFIGGGFTGALHNILEPASFGNVILFGPKHNKFHEAHDLILEQAAFNISDVDDLLGLINHLEIDDQIEKSQQAAINYISNNTGATSTIFRVLQL